MTAITEQVYQAIKTINTQNSQLTPAHQRQIAELTGLTRDTIEYELKILLRTGRVTANYITSTGKGNYGEPMSIIDIVAL